MPYHDLNVLYQPDHTDLAHTLLFHHELGYKTVALATLVTGKLPSSLPIIPTSEILSKIPAGLQILTRMTLTISDTAQNHRISSLQSSYDMLALRPTTEKCLQLCCSGLECDLISLDFSQRLAFPLRFKTVASALQKGIRFEICYSCGIHGGIDARRNLISNATALIRATRGRGIIISSEARNALGVRGPADAINLAQVWSLSQERGKEAVCEEAGRVVKLASLKRTSYRGVVDIIDGGRASNTTSAKDVRGEIVETPFSIGSGVTGQDHMQQLQPMRPSNNSAKRKASTGSLGPQQIVVAEDGDKPISKREMKRRAKRARLEGKETNGDATRPHQASAFPIRHESYNTASTTAAATTQEKAKINQKQ